MERLKTEFISVVSHELRTPLTSIRGALGLILGSMADAVPQNVKTLLDIANNNCERLIPLINDILDIDKMASGKMRFDVQEHSLARIARLAVEEMQPYAQKLNVTIGLTPIDAELSVAVDEMRFIQVLSNLMSNAAKFSPPGSQVSIEVRTTDDRVRLYVRDNGPGIPEAFRARIFEEVLAGRLILDAAGGRHGTGTTHHATDRRTHEGPHRLRNRSPAVARHSGWTFARTRALNAHGRIPYHSGAAGLGGTDDPACRKRSRPRQCDRGSAGRARAGRAGARSAAS